MDSSSTTKNPTTNDNLVTLTSVEQFKTEKSCISRYVECEKLYGPMWRKEVRLLRNQHVSYLMRGLQQLGVGYTSLDASRPWLVFWISHALELLDAYPYHDNVLIDRICGFLNKCQSKSGGFGGGPGQLPHVAPTYAAVHALLICGTKTAYEVIDRQGIYNFLMKLKQPDGSFLMHENGEVDIRGTYCALSCARALNILTDELTHNTAEWIVSCQNFDGGIGGEPFNESHGGYAFCGLATLVILGKTEKLDKKAFLKWAAKRQLPVEGGFQGRQNKLVDGCYSFWQGGVFPLLDEILINPDKYQAEVVIPTDENFFGAYPGGWCFDQKSLQEYLLVCCQNPAGGLIDKPDKKPDFYHTCYTLSGMSVAQNNPAYLIVGDNHTVVGCEENLLKPIDAIHNIGTGNITKALTYFSQKPPIN